ncbi:MAG: DUF2142 domain-containing protein [Ilumatobacteraceae bacterium]
MSRSGGDGRPLIWSAAATAFTIIGCTWAFSIARYGGPDEPAHVIRAAAAAHGDLRGKPVDGLEPGYRQVSVPVALASGDPACFRHAENTDASCSVAAHNAREIEAATSAGGSPPWYYVMVGLVARLLSNGRRVLAYRMASVLLCAGVLGYALARARRYGGAAWLLVSLTPSAWFLMGVVGTSGIEIALVALALVEAVGRFHSVGHDASLARVAVPLGICLLLRPAAFVDIAVVALVVAPTLSRPLGWRRVATITSPVAVAGIATLAWGRWVDLVVSDRRTADTDSLITAVRRSVEGIPLTAHQTVGALGWNEFYAPPAAQLAWIVGLCAAVYWVATHSPDRWWHARWIVAAVLLPTIVEVVGHRRIGEIWQGRYSISFAMGGVLIAAARCVPRRWVMRVIVIAAAGAEVLTLWHTLRRYMVGLDGSLTLRHAAWHPPLNPWLLLAVNAAAIAWLGAVALSPPAEPGRARFR